MNADSTMAQRWRPMAACEGIAVLRTKNSLQRLMIHEDREMMAVLRYKWNRFRPKITAKASICLSVRCIFSVFQSSWRVSNRATVSIGINVHYNGTQTIRRGVDRQFHKKLMVVVRQHICRRQVAFYSTKGFFTAQFQVMVPKSSYRGWTSVDNLGMKLVSAANILKKERISVTLRGIGASLMALTFTSVGRRPCSEKRSSKQKVL